MSPLLSHAILRAQTDERLIELARERHERAFEVLVERYRKPLHRNVRGLLPEARAEDAVQQTFINAWTALQRGVEVREPRAWLYRVAHNAALNALRVHGYEYAELQESLRSHLAGPEEDHERRWVMRRTLAGLAALPEAQREALLRTAVEGRSQEQVAAELGLSEGAVRGLVYRARTALRTAATALTPSPLLGWAVAFASGGEPSSTTERIAEVAAGGGTAGAGAVLAKAGAVVAVTGALAGGAVAVREEAGGGRDGPAAAKADAVSSRDLGRAGLGGGPGPGGRGPGDDRGGHGRGEGEGHGRGQGRDHGRGDGHPRRGKGRGKGEGRGSARPVAGAAAGARAAAAAARPVRPRTAPRTMAPAGARAPARGRAAPTTVASPAAPAGTAAIRGRVRRAADRATSLRAADRDPRGRGRAPTAAGPSRRGRAAAARPAAESRAAGPSTAAPAVARRAASRPPLPSPRPRRREVGRRGAGRPEADPRAAACQQAPPAARPAAAPAVASTAISGPDGRSKQRSWRAAAAPGTLAA